MRKVKFGGLFLISLFAFEMGCTCGSAQQTGTTAQPVSSSHPPAMSFGDSPSTPIDANIFVKLAKKVVPSVVNISSTSIVKSPYGQGQPDDLFRRFFEDFFGNGQQAPWGGRPGKPPMTPKNLPKAVALGTGFIIDSSGLILTNNHVVENADEIKISFTEESNEKPTHGEVVGRDPELDVALIKVATKRELVALPLGDSEALEVGEYVMAVGNPFGQGHSVTHGIISAKGRPLPEFVMSTYLQTDAPINPGNSGGPLVNLKGEVIGINNAIDARAHGIGFAIPANAVKTILPQLREKGSVARGYIGVLVGELSPEIADQVGASKDLHAPFVTHIYPGEPADQAGVKAYDVIVEFNGKTISSSPDLIAAVTSVPIGHSAPMKILRNGKEKILTVKVAKRPGTAERVQYSQKKEKPSGIDTGMALETVTPELARRLGIRGRASGVVVTNVEYGSPAFKAGLAQQDIIVEVDRKPVPDVDAFNSIVKEKKSYLLRIRREDPNGQEGFAVIVLNLKE